MHKPIGDWRGVFQAYAGRKLVSSGASPLQRYQSQAEFPADTARQQANVSGFHSYNGSYLHMHDLYVSRLVLYRERHHQSRQSFMWGPLCLGTVVIPGHSIDGMEVPADKGRFQCLYKRGLIPEVQDDETNYEVPSSECSC